jgi:hypothetical protein
LKWSSSSIADTTVTWGKINKELNGVAKAQREEIDELTRVLDHVWESTRKLTPEVDFDSPIEHPGDLCKSWYQKFLYFFPTGLLSIALSRYEFPRMFHESAEADRGQGLALKHH